MIHLERKGMAMGVVGAIYKFKYFIFCRQKNTGKMTRAQGKDRENTGNLVLFGAWQPVFPCRTFSTHA